MHKIGTNTPLIIGGFHMKYGRWDTLKFFQKKIIQDFTSEILIGKSLRRNLIILINN